MTNTLEQPVGPLYVDLEVIQVLVLSSETGSSLGFPVVAIMVDESNRLVRGSKILGFRDRPF